MVNRTRLLRDHADELNAAGERVTIERMRQKLKAQPSSYSLKTDQISAALKLLRDLGEVDSYTNGKRVSVGEATYRSIREAAEREEVAVETVRRRIASRSPRFASWKYTD